MVSSPLMPDAAKEFVNVIRDGGVLTARITAPNVEESEALVLFNTVRAAIDQAGSDLQVMVLDLGEVTFINSSGLAVCIRLRNGAAEHGARTIVYRAREDVTDLFRLVQVDRLYAFASDAQELDNLVSQ